MPGFDLDVAVVESLGDEVVVNGRVAAELLERAEETVIVADEGTPPSVVARLSPRERPAEGTTIRPGIDPGDVHVFDAASGERLATRPAALVPTQEG